MLKGIGDYVNNKEINANLIYGKFKKKDVKMMSPLQLAYIGDAVYEVFIRTYLLKQNNLSVHELHKNAIKYVKAEAQANIIHLIEKRLTDEEWNIVKRGRNAKSGTVPKNANISDYRYATGFETLIGFLYLTENHIRLNELLHMIVEEY